MLLASEAPVAVVLRRGPTKFVRVFLWNREHDTFEEGSRFQGKIYAEISDISPDGRLFLYFAMGGVKWAIPETKGTWTAISRLPSLTAFALWGHGDCRSGGGVFTSNSSYWLDFGINTFRIRDNEELRRGSYPPPGSRMERRGWIARDKSYRQEVFDKSLPQGWILRRVSHPYKAHHYELEQPERRLKLMFPKWEWAEWDRERLVWTEAGRLHAASLGSDELGAIRTLHNFNEDKACDAACARY